MAKPSKASDDILKEAREAFELCEENEADNRQEAKKDIEFGPLGKQWSETDRKQREEDGRPCLTLNKIPAIIRQVVNDGRQNKPAITVHPADSQADKETAEILNGIIRNIEHVSSADIAYDTALESACTAGWGFIKVNTAYCDDDSFDKDIRIETVTNPFSIYGDPYDTAADSSNWNTAFETEMLSKKEFKAKFKGALVSDWEDDHFANMAPPWREGEQVRIARWWRRELAPRTILLLSSGEVVGEDAYTANKDLFDSLQIEVKAERQVQSHKVTHCLLSGAEVLEENELWGGRYIPIVPVYGVVVNLEGKRYLKGIVRDVRDPQRQFNFWRTAATEAVAMATKAPWIGRKGAFDTDSDKWATANQRSWAYIEYDGPEPPERQPFPGPPAGAIQEAMNAADDMKAIAGLHDPSMGAEQDQEQSGRAILALQKKGDVGSFHYVDNLARAIRHAGRIILDLVPTVYHSDRIVRIMGADGVPTNVPVNQPVNVPARPLPGPLAPQVQPFQQGQAPQIDPNTGQPLTIQRAFDLTVGKYDAVVECGPSFGTRRQEAAQQMVELVRAYPDAAPVIGPELAKNLDWPGADEIAEKLEGIQANQGKSPQAQAQAQIDMQKLQLEGQKQQTQAQLDAHRAMIEGQRFQFDIQAHHDKVALEHRKLDLEHQKILSETQTKREGIRTVAHTGLAKQAMGDQTKLAVAHVDTASDLIVQASESHDARLMAAHESEEAERDRQHQAHLADKAAQAAKSQRPEQSA